MTTRRMIEFEAASDDAADRVTSALEEAFSALAEEEPSGVRLEYWRVGSGLRFIAVIELADDQVNPLLSLKATRALPTVIGDSVVGGYPTPILVESVGSYRR